LVILRSTTTGIFALTLAAVLPGLALADDARHAADVKAQVEHSDNLCFGGLEDGKIIVGEQYLKNPYKETTRLGCEVDGGAPVTMPDLPPPDAAKTRLV
jgi:hypothetical protein